MAEVLDQGAIDKVIAAQMNKGNVSDDKPSGTVVNYVCMHCKHKLRWTVDSNKPMTSYFPTPKNWRGQECTSPYGHGFVTEDRLKQIRW